MREKMSRFMMGRYGTDDLAKLSMVITLICIVISFFWQNLIFNFFIWGMLIWTYFRMLSRNTSKRYAENLQFLKIKDSLLGRNKTKKDPYYKIYLCPSCRQKIRVPRGKGKICITCPACKREFLKRT